MRFKLLILFLFNSVAAAPAGKKAAPTPSEAPAQAWNYSDIPDWHDDFPVCGGEDQSPLNLRFQDTPSAPKVDRIQFHYSPTPVTVAFSSFSLRALFNTTFDTLQAEHLGNRTYVLTQIHFHWDATDDKGSEHRLNGHQYPLEMHMVHYLTSCGSQAGCMTTQGGLTVFAVLFQIGAPNNDFQLLLDAEGSITDFPVAKFLPEKARNEFVYYNGSLTTPPCSEGVNWIIARELSTVSEAQLTALRSLMDSRTWRTPQPADGRVPKTSWLSQPVSGKMSGKKAKRAKNAKKANKMSATGR